MPVSLLDLQAQHAPLDDELKEAFARVLGHGQFCLGTEVTSFESEVAAYTGAPSAIATSSGTDALLLALMALDVGPGDEVLLPTFTFFATGGCVARLGATPVFTDISPLDFNIDVEDAEARTTERTRAVLPVHLYGQQADMPRVLEFAKASGLRVVEDAAQALGAEAPGGHAGTMGDFGVYSFYPTKNLGALGDAGMLVGGNAELVEKARVLRVHGMVERYYHKSIGGNFRMDGVQAALLRVKFPHLDAYNARRREIAGRYRSGMLALEGVAENDGGWARELPNPSARLLVPGTRAGNTHIWHQFTVLAGADTDRNDLKDFLAQREIASGIYYPLTLDKQECFAPYTQPDAAYPVAEYVSRNCLSLPIHPAMTDAQANEVVGAVAAFLRR